MNQVKCQKCSTNRCLDAHIFELSEYCRFVGSEVQYSRFGNTRNATTFTVASWLRLAGELDNVEINRWKYDDGLASMYCEPVAYKNDSDSKHYSNYATVLTRFIYVTYALEEVYRLVDGHYDELPNIKRASRPLNDSSMRAAVLLDKYNRIRLPIDFQHIYKNLKLSFLNYDSKFEDKLSGTRSSTELDISFGLHLIRNIRNYVAHGVFPIAENPEFYNCDKDIRLASQLLLCATRMAAIYIQIFIFNFNDGFYTDEYNQNSLKDDFDDTENYFAKNCTFNLGLTLHKEQGFSFSDPLGYHC